MMNEYVINNLLCTGNLEMKRGFLVMYFMRRIFFIFAFSLLNLNFACPDEPVTSPELSLDEAVQTAFNNNHAIKEAGLEIGKSRDMISAIKTKKFPTLKLEVLEFANLTPIDFEFKEGIFGDFAATGPIPAENTTITTDTQFNTFFVASLIQPVTQLYRVNLIIHQHEMQELIAGEKFRLKKHTVINRVKRLYFTILQAQSELAAAEDAVKFYSEISRSMEQKVKEKTVLEVEKLEVQTQLAKSEHEALVLKNLLSSHKESLNLLLGRDIQTPFEVQEVPDVAADEVDLNAAQEKALAERPEIKATRLAIREKEYEAKIKKSHHVPDISLVLAYSSPFNVEFLPQDVVYAGVYFTWNPFDWGMKSKVVRAIQKGIEQKEHRLKDVEAEIRIEINRLSRKLEESRSLLKVSDFARKAADEKLRITMNRFKDDKALLEDILLSQHQLAEANDQYQGALSALWTARADFEKALGEE
jgi:outer membrane protein